MVGSRYVITEILSGKEQAIGAMVFSAFVLIVMSLPLFSERTIDKKFAMVFMLTVGGIMAGLSLLIIRNTWRRTTLSPDAPIVEVLFTAPLSATRRLVSPPR